MKTLIVIGAFAMVLAGCASTGGNPGKEEDCRLGNEAGSTGVGALFGPLGAIVGYGAGKVASNVRCK